MDDDLDDLEVETVEDDNQVDQPEEVTDDQAVETDDSGEAPQTEDKPADGSLTDDTEDHQPPQAEPAPGAPADDFEQVRRRAAEFQTRYQQANEKLKQFEGVTPDDVRAFRQQQERMQLDQLPAHNRYSPKHRQFREAHAKALDIHRNVQRIQQQVQLPDDDPRRLDPAQANALIEQEQARLGDDDRQMLEAQQQHASMVNEALYSNPQAVHLLADTEGFLNHLFERFMQGYEQRSEAKRGVDGWFEKNPQLVEKYGGELNAMLRDGVKWQTAVKHIEALAKVDGLQSQSEQLSRKASAAAARDEVRKQEATLTVDPAKGGGKQSWRDEFMKARQRGEMVDELDVIAQMDADGAISD